MRWFTSSFPALLTGLVLLSSACSDSNPMGPGATGVNPTMTVARAWYAAPSGSATADGSASAPWDLTTALSGGNGKVQPGDTIWLRGGTYAGTFASNLRGSASAPITVRQYPKERATLDGGSGTGGQILVVDGQWTTYWGFELMQSGTQRWGVAGTGNGLRQTGVWVRAASDVKLVNLVIHDLGHGIYTENDAHNIEIYGGIFYNGGYEDGRRSDGHGIYIKNDGIGSKVARDNVIFNQFGYGIHGYTESTGQLRHLVFDGNVLFNNGTVSSFHNNPNLQVGGNGVADADTVTNNLLYFSPGLGEYNARMGYSSMVNGASLFAGNTLVGGTQALDVGYWQNLSVRDNTVSGPNMMVVQHDANARETERWSGNAYQRDPAAAAWQLGLPKSFGGWASDAGASDQTASPAAGADVIVRANRYEAGRATVVVNNWSQAGSVAIDLSGVLALGSHYEIRNVQDLYGAPIVSGTYSGGRVSVPMNGVNPPQPIGGSPTAPRRTAPDFDVFVVTAA